MTNAEIARQLKEIRALMEFAGEPFFKFMAYERAAETIENAAPLADLSAGGRLQELPGVGKSIAARIAELCATGTCGYLEELRARYPSTLLEVLGVGGVGMKTAQLLYERLGVASLAGLEAALAAGALARSRAWGRSRSRTSAAACWPTAAAETHAARRRAAAGPRNRRLSGSASSPANDLTRPAACGATSRWWATSTSSAPRTTRPR